MKGLQLYCLPAWKLEQLPRDAMKKSSVETVQYNILIHEWCVAYLGKSTRTSQRLLCQQRNYCATKWLGWISEEALVFPSLSHQPHKSIAGFVELDQEAWNSRIVSENWKNFPGFPRFEEIEKEIQGSLKFLENCGPYIDPDDMWYALKLRIGEMIFVEK
ncbi:hypothetical protein G7Y89_g8364 [Cudoniella acicularis]|uniref:Uncharacterized protein n=1 Tax=Cudoniella acicularis TaxID=354080 RepID=A0A8H4RJ13_9HELO|nr:hypothetical protein G7Y89_g8364 [Cudoniella acicularis]